MGDFYFEMESALTEKREKREIEWMKSKRLMMHKRTVYKFIQQPPRKGIRFVYMYTVS